MGFSFLLRSLFSSLIYIFVYTIKPQNKVSLFIHFRQNNYFILNRMIRKFISSALIVLCCIAFSANKAHSQTEPLEILFLGNSYTNYNHLPDIVSDLALNSGKEIYVESYAPGGQSLHDHASSFETYLRINQKKWDFIILQGTGRRIAYPESYSSDPSFEALTSLKQIIHENCVSTRILFFMPWADEDGMTWVANRTEDYFKMQVDIYLKTIEFSEALDLSISPVGWAWYRVLYEKELPLHYLHSDDWNHPNSKGSFLAACVIFSSIFIESTTNNPYYPSGLDHAEGDYLKTTASEIVLNDLELWKITPYIDSTFNDITTGISKPDHLNNLSLDQNYPNPFLNLTKIKYTIDEKDKVEISVYDQLGKKLAILVDEEKFPGSYEIEFNGNKLQSGIFFYSLKTNKKRIIKKMQKI